MQYVARDNTGIVDLGIEFLALLAVLTTFLSDPLRHMQRAEDMMT